MKEKVDQYHDKDYKFKYKHMGLKIHNYLYNTNYTTIKFLDTEDAKTGNTRDIVFIADGTDVHHVEFESQPVTDDKVKQFYRNYRDTVSDIKYLRNNSIKFMGSYCICLNKPEKEPYYLKTEPNYIFKLPIIYPKLLDGEKILTTLKEKVEKQEKLTDNNQAELLLLPDTDINMETEALMKEIAFIIRNANISSDDYKNLAACYVQTFKRFFEGNELSEMLKFLKKETKDEKIAGIIEKYGYGFDDVYRDGKYEAKIEDAKNLLLRGFDETIICECIKLPITEIKKLKRELNIS